MARTWHREEGEGPWGGRAGGPWGQGDGSSGGGPRRGRSPSGQGPDLDEILRKSEEKIRTLFGKGRGGGRGGKGIGLTSLLLGVAGLIVLWLMTGFYKVDEGEKGVEMIFGRLSSISDQGLRYNFPYPIGETYVKNVTNVNILKSGAKVRHKMLMAEGSSNQMVTKDLNIVELKFAVHWNIKDIKEFVFNDPNPEDTIKEAAESAMREVIAQRRLDSVLRLDKEVIARDCKELLQRVLDEYKIGVNVREVLLDPPDVPDSVVDSYRNLHQASAKAVTLQNEAQQYRNSIIPKARGQAQEIIQQSEGYKLSVVADAEGEASRFMALVQEFEKAPRVTKDRLHIDTLQKLLKGMKKVIVDGTPGTQGVLPYLPLPELKQKSSQEKSE